MDTTADVATVQVKHVPPIAPRVKLPAEWMRPPVADTPNNWVQVRRQGEAYVASTGKETFDVELKVRLSTGEILSATLDNLVEAVARDCRNAELTECGEPRPNRTVRHIEMMLTGQ